MNIRIYRWTFWFRNGSRQSNRLENVLIVDSSKSEKKNEKFANVVRYISSDRLTDDTSFPWIKIFLCSTIDARRLVVVLFSFCIQGKTSNDVSFGCFSKNHVSSLNIENCKCNDIMFSRKNDVQAFVARMQTINLYYFLYSTHRNKNIHSFFN